MRRWLALLAWLGFVVFSINALHRAGASFPMGLIGDRAGPLEPALAAAFRLAGLGAGYWLAGSTVVYFVGLAAGGPEAIRAVRWVTFAPVRRLVDGVVTGALVASMGIPAGVAAALAPGYVPVPAGDRPADGTLTGDEVDPGTPVEDESAIPPPPPPRTGTEIEVVVRSGDNMWKLAEQRLSDVQRRAVSDSEVALYWLKVIAVNLPRIRSADPDLIYPGEVLVMPALDP